MASYPKALKFPLILSRPLVCFVSSYCFTSFRWNLHLWYIICCLQLLSRNEVVHGQVLTSRHSRTDVVGFTEHILDQPLISDSPHVFQHLFSTHPQLFPGSSPSRVPIKLIQTRQSSTRPDTHVSSCDVTGQDYCTKPGLLYPRDEIGFFIDENRSMMKRMFGPVSGRSLLLRKDEEDTGMDNSDVRRRRRRRQLVSPKSHPTVNNQAPSVYLCAVEEELITPFWALNGTGVRLAIVNTPPFEQAVHTVRCRNSNTNYNNHSQQAAQEEGLAAEGGRGGVGRCHATRSCWCMQEYSWFRLLAYDIKDNCKGIYMDWFKFPSHCACKCLQDSSTNDATVAMV